MKRKRTCSRFLVLLPLAGLFWAEAQSQPMSSFDRDRALLMLDDVAKDVQKHYYDPNFHGVDWDAAVLEARRKIKAETSLNLALAHIAAALISLNDSHTFFLPPSRPYVHDYGFQMEMIGAQCYVIRVRPGSDAETKGLKPGDEVLTINGYQPDRTTLWKMEYRYNTLRPEPGLRLDLRDVQ